MSLVTSLAKQAPAISPSPDLPRDPGQGEYQDLPARVPAFTEWDSVQVVQMAITQLEWGQFQMAALLCDAILRDDRVQAVLNTYINGVLGLPFGMDPAGDPDKPQLRAIKVAEACKDEWPLMVPKSQLTSWLLKGEMLGLGIGELVWKKTDSKWTPTLKVHHNQFVYWDWEERVYKFHVRDGQVDLIPGDGHWALYMPGGYQYGWMYGLIRSIWMQWMVRQFAYRDWARYSEVHGSPIRGAVMPAETTDDEARLFVNAIARVARESVVKLKQNQQGDKFDLKLIEAVANSEQSFDRLIQRAEESIAIRVLGQNLSTQVRGGSFAAASAHENVRQDVKDAFAGTITTDARHQILKPYVYYNFGDTELAPYPDWDTSPPEDDKTNAEASEKHAKAIQEYRAGRLNLDAKKYCDKYGIPLVEGEDPWLPDLPVPAPVAPDDPEEPAPKPPPTPENQ